MNDAQLMLFSIVTIAFSAGLSPLHEFQDSLRQKKNLRLDDVSSFTLQLVSRVVSGSYLMIRAVVKEILFSDFVFEIILIQILRVLYITCYYELNTDVNCYS